MPPLAGGSGGSPAQFCGGACRNGSPGGCGTDRSAAVRRGGPRRSSLRPGWRLPTARRSFGLASIALVLYGAATVVFAATAAPQFDDFPQGAPTAFAGQVAVAVLAITAIRALRWRREPVLPEDRLRLIANGSVIASAALFSGLLLEAAVALTRPAGVLPWSEAPLVLVLFMVSAVAASMASVVAVVASVRSSTLAAVPGGESEPDLTLSADFVELFPSLHRVGEITFARPRRLVAVVAALAFCATTASQWFGTDVSEHASIVLPALFSASARSRRS